MDTTEVVRVVESCIVRSRWRLRSAAKRRLETDILALYTGLRPVVMVDYGGKMPELQEHLCALMRLAHKESSLLLPLRVMIIEDMIYVIHVKELVEHARPTATRPLYVDLEQDPLKILSQSDENAIVEELVSIQKLFSSITPVGEVDTHPISDKPPALIESKTDLSKSRADELYCHSENDIIQASVLIDLSSCMKDTSVTIPTLNGWLLGYPVVYLFGKDHIADAVYHLSTKSLHLYKIVVSRRISAGRELCEEMLMSFTVPYDLSMGGEESWASAFLTHMMDKFERCRPAWASLRLEVTKCGPQAVVL